MLSQHEISAATITEVEQLTKTLADARSVLADRLRRLEEETTALKRRLLPGIKSAAASAGTIQAQLHELVDARRDLFVDPRTITAHGIRVGLMKGKGRMEWDDPALVCRLIRKHFPEQAEVLIKTTEKPLAKALAQLSVAELRRLGVCVEEAGDQVLIKAVDGEIDKLVEAIIAEELEADPKEAA